MAARLTARDLQLRAITERAWQAKVQTMLTAYGWAWYHPGDNIPRNGRIQNVRAGFPDLCAVRGRRLLFIELKRETGRTTQDQDAWLERLAATGAETYVWRPSDSTRVADILRHEYGS